MARWWSGREAHGGDPVISARISLSGLKVGILDPSVAVCSPVPVNLGGTRL